MKHSHVRLNVCCYHSVIPLCLVAKWTHFKTSLQGTYSREHQNPFLTLPYDHWWPKSFSLPFSPLETKKHLEDFLPTQLKASFPGIKATKTSPWNLLSLMVCNAVEQGISYMVLYHVYSVKLWVKPHVLKPFKLVIAHLIVPVDTEFAPLHLWLSNMSLQP